MLIVAYVLLALLVIAVTPYLVGLYRSVSFATSEGSRGVLVPNKGIDAQLFRRIYTSPHARVRSRGAHFSDLVWYLLSPGSHMHQEVMEEGPAYDAVAAVTKKVLAVPARAMNEMITRIFEKEVDTPRGAQIVYLRDLFMPLFARYFFELLFKHEPSADEVATVVNNAHDFIECTKFHKMADLSVRTKLVDLIREEVWAGRFAHDFDYGFSTDEKCFYLRGLFLTSGVTQMSEAMAHILLCLAKNRNIQEQLAETKGRTLLSQVIDESLRLFPLFGVSFRIVSSDIDLGNGKKVAKDSVVFFHYKEYQKAGFADAKTFMPERWAKLQKNACHFMPFGEAKNHPCPAGGMSKILLGRCVELMLERYRIYSSATHTRALPNRGPCVLVDRQERRSVRWRLARLFLNDRLHIFGLSLKQLFVGAAIKRRARKLQVATRYFGN